MPPRVEPHPSRSPQIEQYLTDRGFTWEYRIGIPLKEFDEEKSLRNQARVGKPIDKGTVERYIIDLTNGDVFPALIAAEASKSRPLLIADGNHRFQAHKAAGRESVDAYVVIKASPAAITTLTFEANTKHGLPTSEEDRLHQALYLMDAGLSAEDAARRLGLRPATLRAASNLAAVDRRADECRLNRNAWDRLPNSVKLRLGQISTDEGFGAMGKLVLDAGLRTEDVAKCVNDMAPLRSSAKQVEYVKAARLTYAEHLQTGGKPGERATIGRQARSGRHRYGMLLGNLAAMPEPNEIIGRMTDDEKPEWLRRTDAAIQRLEKIREALKK